MKYRSVNSVLEVVDVVNYPIEFFNLLNPSKFSLHFPTLKVGTPVMLQRNLCPPKLYATVHVCVYQILFLAYPLYHQIIHLNLREYNFPFKCVLL